MSEENAELMRDAVAALDAVINAATGWRDYLAMAGNTERPYDDRMGCYFNAQRCARLAIAAIGKLPEAQCWTRRMSLDDDLPAEVVELREQFNEIVLGATS